jgi:hypothetical protein
VAQDSTAVDAAVGAMVTVQRGAGDTCAVVVQTHEGDDAVRIHSLAFGCAVVPEQCDVELVG